MKVLLVGRQIVYSPLDKAMRRVSLILFQLHLTRLAAVSDWCQSWLPKNFTTSCPLVARASTIRFPLSLIEETIIRARARLSILSLISDEPLLINWFHFISFFCNRKTITDVTRTRPIMRFCGRKMTQLKAKNWSQWRNLCWIYHEDVWLLRRVNSSA